MEGRYSFRRRSVQSQPTEREGANRSSSRQSPQRRSSTSSSPYYSRSQSSRRSSSYSRSQSHPRSSAPPRSSSSSSNPPRSWSASRSRDTTPRRTGDRYSNRRRGEPESWESPRPSRNVDTNKDVKVKEEKSSASSSSSRLNEESTKADVYRWDAAKATGQHVIFPEDQSIGRSDQVASSIVGNNNNSSSSSRRDGVQRNQKSGGQETKPNPTQSRSVNDNYPKQRWKSNGSEQRQAQAVGDIDNESTSSGSTSSSSSTSTPADDEDKSKMKTKKANHTMESDESKNEAPSEPITTESTENDLTTSTFPSLNGAVEHILTSLKQRSESNLSDRVKDLEQSVSTLKRQNSELVSENHALRDAIAKASSSSSRAESELKSLSHLMHKLEASLSRIETLSKTNSAEMTRVSATLESDMISKSSSLEAIQGQVSVLTSAIQGSLEQRVRLLEAGSHHSALSPSHQPPPSSSTSSSSSSSSSLQPGKQRVTSQPGGSTNVRSQGTSSGFTSHIVAEDDLADRPIARNRSSMAGKTSSSSSKTNTSRESTAATAAATAGKRKAASSSTSSSSDVKRKKTSSSSSTSARKRSSSTESSSSSSSSSTSSVDGLMNTIVKASSSSGNKAKDRSSAPSSRRVSSSSSSSYLDLSTTKNGPKIFPKTVRTNPKRFKYILKFQVNSGPIVCWGFPGGISLVEGNGGGFYGSACYKRGSMATRSAASKFMRSAERVTDSFARSVLSTCPNASNPILVPIDGVLTCSLHALCANGEVKLHMFSAHHDRILINSFDPGRVGEDPALDWNSFSSFRNQKSIIHLLFKMDGDDLRLRAVVFIVDTTATSRRH